MRTIIIQGKGVPVDFFDPALLSNEEQIRLLRLVSWKYDGDQFCYVLFRRAPHKVGRVRIRNVVFSVVPDMAASDFTSFFLYSLGVRIERFSNSQSSEIALAFGNKHADFEVLAATLLINTCEDLARNYLAKSYVTKKERVNTIRGRIDWSKYLSPQNKIGVPCIFSEISLDNVINQVVLAGLCAAQRIELNAQVKRRLNELVFIWSSITTRQHVNIEMLQLAEKSLNRLTERYRTALGLCRMIMFGYGPDDFFQGRSTDFQCIEFDLSVIFERFVLRLIKQRLSNTGLSVQYQITERNVLRNGVGQTYHATRPDFFILNSGVPVAILDAKYKPRYVSHGAEGFGPKNKVVEADVYQMLFYAQRARQLASGKDVQAFIVAPLVDPELEIPSAFQRQIHWVHQGESEVTINVVEVDLLATIGAIREFTPFPEDGLAKACAAIARECCDLKSSIDNVSELFSV